VEQKGGKNSLYAVDYAARVAQELGADVVKLNMPVIDDRGAASPKPYDSLRPSRREALRQVIGSAGRCLVIFAGGERKDEADLLQSVRDAMEAGATGFIFGRNIWQRPWDEAMAVTAAIREILQAYPR
ncbi:MAG: fructose-bisphosphate aldolase, partial [Clostridia bacterium]|nr:fructose-bisphosphate aldolase [Clostridia bacterium]